MAIQVRQLTGPIETPDSEVVETGTLRVRLLFPIAYDSTFIAPYKLDYTITDGELPASAKVTAPGKYEFRINDYADNSVYSFQQTVFTDSGSPISIAELWLLSRLDDPDCGGCMDWENFDAATLGSDGSPEGYVLTADGDGGTDWLPVAALTPGDMTKAVYDPDDDGRVLAADHATEADLAADATLFGGLAPSAYQEALADASSAGAILTWDTGLSAYTPNNNFLVDDDGNILAGGIKIIGALYGNVFVMDQVYYLVDDETHVLVIKEDDVELRLPDPTLHDGRIVEIKKESDDGNDVLITVAGGGQIEGQANYSLLHRYDAITVVSINGEWFIF